MQVHHPAVKLPGTTVKVMGEELELEIERPDMRNKVTLEQAGRADLYGGEVMPSPECVAGPPCTNAHVTVAGLDNPNSPFRHGLRKIDNDQAADRALGRCKNKITGEIEPNPHPQFGRFLKIQVPFMAEAAAKCEAAG